MQYSPSSRKARVDGSTDPGRWAIARRNIRAWFRIFFMAVPAAIVCSTSLRLPACLERNIRLNLVQPLPQMLNEIFLLECVLVKVVKVPQAAAKHSDGILQRFCSGAENFTE